MELFLRRSYPEQGEPERDYIWSVVDTGAAIGTILYTAYAPEGTDRWQWIITANLNRTPYNKTGRAPSREAAMAAFKETWAKIRAYIGPDAWWHIVAHIERVTNQGDGSALDTHGRELLAAYRRRRAIDIRVPRYIGECEA